MKNYWVDMHAPGRTAYSFWSHEWTKHGTCAVRGGMMASQTDYFRTSIALTKNLTVLRDELAAEGMEPNTDEAYSPEHISATIEAALGVHTAIACVHVTKDGVDYWALNEIRVCINVDRSLRDCPAALHDQCGKKDVYFLPISRILAWPQ